MDPNSRYSTGKGTGSVDPMEEMRRIHRALNMAGEAELEFWVSCIDALKKYTETLLDRRHVENNKAKESDF